MRRQHRIKAVGGSFYIDSAEQVDMIIKYLDQEGINYADLFLTPHRHLLSHFPNSLYSDEGTFWLYADQEDQFSRLDLGRHQEPTGTLLPLSSRTSRDLKRVLPWVERCLALNKKQRISSDNLALIESISHFPHLPSV